MGTLGFEPKTCGLKVQCSTTELRTRLLYLYNKQIIVRKELRIPSLKKIMR